MTTWRWTTDPEDARMWDVLERAIAAMVAVSDDTVTIDAESQIWESGVYVQTCVEDDGDLTIEAVSNEFLNPPLPVDAINTLHELGWEDPPGEGLPNYLQYLEADQTAPAHVAKILVETLRRVYGVRPDAEFTFSPAEVAVDAFGEQLQSELVNLDEPPTRETGVAPDVDSLIAWAARHPDRFNDKCIDILKDLREKFPQHATQIDLGLVIDALDNIQLRRRVAYLRQPDSWARALSARCDAHPLLLKNAIRDGCAMVRYSLAQNPATPAQTRGVLGTDPDLRVAMGSAASLEGRARRLSDLLVPSEIAAHSCATGDAPEVLPMFGRSWEGLMALLVWIVRAHPATTVGARLTRIGWEWEVVLDAENHRSVLHVSREGVLAGRAWYSASPDRSHRLDISRLDSRDTPALARGILLAAQDLGVVIGEPTLIPNGDEDVMSAELVLDARANTFEALCEMAMDCPWLELEPVTIDGFALEEPLWNHSGKNLWRVIVTPTPDEADETHVADASWVIDLDGESPERMLRILLDACDIRQDLWPSSQGAKPYQPLEPQALTRLPDNWTNEACVSAVENAAAQRLTEGGLRCILHQDGYVIEHESAAVRFHARVYGSPDNRGVALTFTGYALATVRATPELNAWLTSLARQWVFGHPVLVSYDNGGNRLLVEHTILADPLNLDEVDEVLEAVMFSAIQLADLVQPQYGGLRYAEER